jgi:protein-S-isoprenylcysteine O-methyltransferase Ste14
MKMQALFVKFLNLWNKIRNSDSMIARGLVYGVYGIGIVIALLILLLVVKMAVLAPSFLRKILDKILERVIGAGLFCGFMIIPTIGIHCYILVVASFLIEDNQRRVAAMTGFVTGQFVMFTSIYNRPLHKRLVQPHSIIMLFLGSFFVQLFWTSRKTLRNWRFLDPKEKETIVVRRLFFLQLEFMLTFFVQILRHPYIPPDSMILPLINSSLQDNANKLVFVRSSFAGWLIGHIFFLILFRNVFKHFVD